MKSLLGLWALNRRWSQGTRINWRRSHGNPRSAGPSSGSLRQEWAAGPLDRPLAPRGRPNDGPTGRSPAFGVNPRLHAAQMEDLRAFTRELMADSAGDAPPDHARRGQTRWPGVRARRR